MIEFFCGYLARTAVLLFFAGGVDPLRLASMGITAISACGFQLAVGVAAVLIRRIAERAGEVAAAEERMSTVEAIAEHTHRDHRERYVALLGTTVPLLAGLADGSLDPADEQVRRRSAVEATRMRRLFAKGDDVSDRLIHELAAEIDVAERNGISVQFAVRGESPEPPRDVRRELLDPAAVILASAVSTARVTVVRTPERVRVSVLGDAPAESLALSRGGCGSIRWCFRRGVWVEVVWQPEN